MKSILLGLEEQILNVYTPQQRQQLKELFGLQNEQVVTVQQLKQEDGKFNEVDTVFSTWGMPTLTEEELAKFLPNLKNVFYAAGSVQHIARPLLARGVRLFSAWQANAVPVAEFTVAQILLANKGYFAASPLRNAANRDSTLDTVRTYPGNYECKVGIIAAGQIGKMVIRALAARQLQVLVYDPFLSAEQALELGAQKAELSEIFAECQTISNHLPNLPSTRGMLDYALFSTMKPNATFINTGRGAQLIEADLVRALQEQPARMALIDVTDPEVLPADHIFYQMPNVLITPHIAGSMNNEVHRMPEYMIQEAQRLQAGQPLKYEVSLAMLETMA